MAGGRSRKASKPGDKRVGKKAARKRTVVLDGTFSIDEIEKKGTSPRKAARTSKKRANKRVAPTDKQTAKSKNEQKAARTTKRPARQKTSKKPAAAESGSVVLASQPGIKNIAELKEALTAAHSAVSAVTIDAGKVESIDTAALQLLVAFANSVRGQSRAVEWTEPSAVFCELADLADLGQRLGIGEGSIAEEDDGLCPVF